MEAQDKKWVDLKNRRLQAWPSTLLVGTTLVKSPLPSFLIDPILPKFERLGLFRGDDTAAGGTGAGEGELMPNHVLVNEYLPGQGISPHEDGDVYHPVVATVTLGSHCVYNLYRKDEKRSLVARILQEPGSCLVTRGATYSAYLHGIDEVTVDRDLDRKSILNWHLLSHDGTQRESGMSREKRISLTYRHVKKVKALLQFGRK